MAHNFVSAPFSARYVRLSTRLAEKGALSRSASKYRPRSSKLGMAATCFVKAPFRNAVTYERVRSGVAIRAKLQESRLKERLSICLRAIAPFPRKACSLAAPLCGDPDSGAFPRISSECRRRASKELFKYRPRVSNKNDASDLKDLTIGDGAKMLKN